jgi:carbon monoxide dehydrogenase subunit G
MQLENSFDVAAAPDVAWRLLNDVPTVLPCMPGAELVDVVSEDAWRAKLHVKLGPISLQFLADVERIDAQPDSVVLAVKAREAKGRGSADARIASSIAPAADGSRVDLLTELELRGAVAQYGRGVIAEVASTLTQRFADCLRDTLVDDEPPVSEPPSELDGLAVVFRAAWRALLKRLRRA